MPVFFFYCCLIAMTRVIKVGVVPVVVGGNGGFFVSFS